jgi:hypothetical protein
MAWVVAVGFGWGFGEWTEGLGAGGATGFGGVAPVADGSAEGSAEGSLLGEALEVAGAGDSIVDSWGSGVAAGGCA